MYILNHLIDRATEGMCPRVKYQNIRKESMTAWSLVETLKEQRSIHKGFYKKHSTYMAAINVVDKISGLGFKICTAALFLDLSKAFDIIDHCILLQTLTSYGVRETVLNWFQSYLSDRYHFCVV